MKKMRYMYMLLVLFAGVLVLTCGVQKVWSEEHGHEEHTEHGNNAEKPHSDHEGHEIHETEPEENGHEEHDTKTVEKAHAEKDHEEKDHEEQDEQDEQDEHGDEEGLRLTPEQRHHFGIVIKNAGPGILDNELSLPGEIVFNEDRVVSLVPRVSGIVRKVNKTVGDRVAAGEIMAVIDSRELADAKAEYLAAVARRDLADAGFKREKTLYNKKISSEQDFLDARQAATEVGIELRTAEQKLHALGYTEKDLTSLFSEHDTTITRYELKAPFAGVVTAKHVSLGKSLEGNVEIFTVADLSCVWVNLTVYMKDLEAVYKGQKVNLKVDHSGLQIQGEVSMIPPFVDEATRSATARIVVDNIDGRWRPGTFVTGHINVSENDAALVVPLDAVQIIENKSVVFVEHEGVFEIIPVQTGRSDRKHVEILAGLEPGAEYVAEGAFSLKATVVTSTLDSHAGHGH